MDANPFFMGAGRNDGTESAAVKFHHVITYDRGFTQSEVRSLTNNPHQILKPRSIYIPEVAAGGVINLVGSGGLVGASQIASIGGGLVG